MQRHLYTSIVIGVVTNNKDPEGLGRVRVRFPWLASSDESHWARVAQFMSGGGRGMWIIPEIDDEVLVTFEHGDVHFPYVIGHLWNGVDRPPGSSGFNADGKNDIRMFQSRAGHQMVFDDSPGGQKIRMMDGSGANTIDIFNPRNSLHHTAASGEIYIRAPQGTITIECTKLETKSTKSTSIVVGKGYSLKVGADAKIEAGTEAKIKTAKSTTVEVAAATSFKAGSQIELKATQVKIDGKQGVTIKSGMLNMVAGIKYGLTAKKLSFDTAVFGILRGVEKLNVKGGILAAVRGLFLSSSTKAFKATAGVALVDMAGALAEFKGSEVQLKLPPPPGAPPRGARPVKLWPPNTSSLKGFKKWADDVWQALPDETKAELKGDLKAVGSKLTAKIKDPWLQAALNGALDGALKGDWQQGALKALYDKTTADALAQIKDPYLKAALTGAFKALGETAEGKDVYRALVEGLYDTAKTDATKAADKAFEQWLKENVTDPQLAAALRGAYTDAKGKAPADVWGAQGVFDKPKPEVPPEVPPAGGTPGGDC
jgi:phage baseplate assembly protein gpV